MNIDLFKLNNLNSILLDESLVIPATFYENSDIRDVNDLKVKGIIKINSVDEIETDLEVSGEFILPCAVTLEDVSYRFSTKTEEIIGNFNDFYDKKQNTLDILPFIWENIVSEVPIKVVSEGVTRENINGDGWELIEED